MLATIQTISSGVQVIGNLVLQGFLHLWPYLLVTIPLAVAVQLSGAARHIRRAFAARPVPAIILATVVGAFSPFCSCGVIPVIASLLIGGVPLGPVMAFWVASPSMDPEIFFLSVATLGWELALWRLLSTLALSLAAGFITHLAVQRGWLAGPVLRLQVAGQRPSRSLASAVRGVLQQLVAAVRPAAPAFATGPCCAATSTPAESGAVAAPSLPVAGQPGSIGSYSDEGGLSMASQPVSGNGSQPGEQGCGEGQCEKAQPFTRRLLRESGSAALMVGKFMLLALVLEAVFSAYVPRDWVIAVVGSSSRLVVISAALIGVPLYTTNLTALPMIGALLGQGMNPSAALAFLIAGPITTMPAMAAVWGLVRRRVFALYVAFALLGAVFFGLLHQLVTSL